MILSLDISLRCTGITLLDLNGNLIDFTIIANEEIKNEQLLDKNQKDISEFVNKYSNVISKIAIEGLSFQSASKVRDLIDANFWGIRLLLWKKFKNIPIDIVPVTQWRKLVIPIERSRELKKLIKWGIVKKVNWQKIECVCKLPKKVKLRFEEYLGKKKNGLFDLTDSYFLGQYIISLKIKKDDYD